MARTALFVYGTLHPDRAPAEIAEDVSRFVSLGSGTVAGRLVQLNGYPGLVSGDERVAGEVFEVPHDPGLIARLDAYEGFLPEDRAGSLFVRERLPVTMGDGSERRCWVYVYHRAG